MNVLSLARIQAAAAVLASLLAVVAYPSRGNAQPKPTAAPAASAADAGFACPLLVLGVVPIDAPERTPAKEYAFALQAFDGPAGSVSGTLAVLADNRMYQVSFEKAIAVGRTKDSLKQLSPIVVKFREAVTVNAAYLGSVRGPNGGACEVAGAWINPEDGRSFTLLDVLTTITKNASKVEAIASGEPGPFVKPGCDSRADPVKTTRVAPVSVPQIASLRQEGGDVYVEVVVDKRGKVATAWIWSASYDDLAGAALAAAKATDYSSARIDCEPITGIYLFVAAFRT